jgi:HEAT repeat protein
MFFLRLSMIAIVTIATTILGSVWMFGSRSTVAHGAPYVLSEEDTEDNQKDLPITIAILVARAQAEGPAPAVIQALTSALKHQNADVRRAAAWALGKIGANALTAWPDLDKLRGDADEKVRDTVGLAMGRIAKKAFGESTQDDDKNWPTPKDLFAVASQPQDPDAAVKALAEALKDPDASVRQTAVQTLGRMGEKAVSAVPALAEVLKDKEVDVRGAAAMALGRMGKKARAAAPGLADLLADPERDVRCAAALALSRIGKEGASGAVPSLLKMLKSEDKYVQVYACCALAILDERTDPHVRVLAEALSDPKTEVRGSAAYVLGELGGLGKAAAPALAKALKDQDKNVRQAVARALGEMSSEVKIVVPALIEALRDSETGVRSAAAMAIGEVGPTAKDAVPALIESLKDKEVEVRGSAVFALGEIGPNASAAISALAGVVTRDEDSEVRRAAALAIGKIQE